ncbi:hypothetical protein J4480_03560 [Candidatus Woesearchaeota archaeon]|nr:hypothetical protein [Candidatus Woesearchaeota archaeon]
MQGTKIFAYLFAVLFLAGIANAAAIHGTIYDLSLKKVSNARVEIDTSPKQVMVAQNGSYSFNVPNGFYTIKAQLMQKNAVIASVQENITIKQDGSYILDLILFPDVEEGVEEINLDINENVFENRNGSAFAVIIIVFIVLAIGAFYHIKKKKSKQKVAKEEAKQEQGDDDLNQLIKIIKNEGGRATQKEIRKQIPLSEAKISLMIAELEHKGIVEKIKKGRGNIIILKRK